MYSFLLLKHLASSGQFVLTVLFSSNFPLRSPNRQRRASRRNKEGQAQRTEIEALYRLLNCTYTQNSSPKNQNLNLSATLTAWP